MRYVFYLMLMLLGVFVGILGYKQRNDFTHPIDTYQSDMQTSLIQQMREVQRLETVEMTVTSIIKSKKEFSDFIPRISIDNGIIDSLFQDELIIEIEGKVTAGFDLSMIGTGDVLYSGNLATILLPQPEIFHSYLTDQTQVFERKLGLLTKGDQKLETDMRNKAQEAVRQAALDEGILAVAENNAKNSLQLLFGDIQVQTRISINDTSIIE